MNNLSDEEQKEVDRLHGVLSDRARGSNSILLSIEIGHLRHDGELDRLRFFERFWGPETSTATINSVYDTAVSLGKQPMEFISATRMETLKSIAAASDGWFAHNAYALKKEVMKGLSVLVLEHPGRESFIASLVIDRKIFDVHEVAGILAAAEDIPTPLTGGSL